MKRYTNDFKGPILRTRVTVQVMLVYSLANAFLLLGRCTDVLVRDIATCRCTQGEAKMNKILNINREGRRCGVCDIRPQIRIQHTLPTSNCGVYSGIPKGHNLKLFLRPYLPYTMPVPQQRIATRTDPCYNNKPYHRHPGGCVAVQSISRSLAKMATFFFLLCSSYIYQVRKWILRFRFSIFAFMLHAFFHFDCLFFSHLFSGLFFLVYFSSSYMALTAGVAATGAAAAAV